MHDLRLRRSLNPIPAPTRQTLVGAGDGALLVMRRGARLPRLLFTVVCVISAALAAGTAAIWLRSHWVGDSILWYTPTTVEGVHVVEFHELMTGSGLVRWDTSYIRFSAEDAKLPWQYRRERPNHPTWGSTSPSWGDRLGFLNSYQFDAKANKYQWNIGGRALCMPVWLPLLVFSIAPSFWLVRKVAALRRRRRRSAGLCPTCGYDLRATPGRCPECGGEIQSSRPAAA